MHALHSFSVRKSTIHQDVNYFNSEYQCTILKYDERYGCCLTLYNVYIFCFLLFFLSFLPTTVFSTIMTGEFKKNTKYK